MGGKERETPGILKPATEWRQVLCFTNQPLDFWENVPQCPLKRRLNGPHTELECFENSKIRGGGE